MSSPPPAPDADRPEWGSDQPSVEGDAPADIEVAVAPILVRIDANDAETMAGGGWQVG